MKLSLLFQHMLLGGKPPGLMETAKPNQKDLPVIQEKPEAGKIVPVIDRCYPLRETLQAIHYLEQGHARGKVVITVEQKSK